MRALCCLQHVFAGRTALQGRRLFDSAAEAQGETQTRLFGFPLLALLAPDPICSCRTPLSALFKLSIGIYVKKITFGSKMSTG